MWAFLGDGETDEADARRRASLAAREELDNLVFVVNCNLQRLDGPVRGNGKIIQELEALFRGAGWNVIKVVWGRSWDHCSRRTAMVPGQSDEQHPRRRFQTYKAETAPTFAITSSDAIRAPRTGRSSGATTRSGPATSAGTTTARCMPRTRRRRSVKGQPTVISGQDHQGLDAGIALRRAQLHAPDEEAHAGAI